MGRLDRTLVSIPVTLLFIWALAAHVSPGFTPVRAELAEARGFSRGILNLVVLRSDQPFAHAPAWSFVVVAAGFLLLSRVPARPLDGWRRLANRAVQAVTLALVAAAVLSSVVTTSRIVFAPRTFVLACLLMTATRIIDAGASARARWQFDALTARRLAIAASGAIGAAFFASMLLQTLTSYGGNYSGFLHVSRETAATAPFLVERPDLAQSLIVSDAGYDGQFMYLMAFDPFLQRFKDQPAEYRRVVDHPPYRYGRIGFSLLTDWLAAGDPRRYPATMVWLIVGAHFGLAAFLAAFAARHGWSPFAGLLYLGVPSFAVSLLFALPEALAATGMVAGILCWESRRMGLAALCFAAALLVRETTIVLIAPLIAMAAIRHRRSGVVLLLSLLPVAAWRTFVASRLFEDFRWHALFTDPGDLTVPFSGLGHVWMAGLLRTQAEPEQLAAVVFPILLVLALALALCLLAVRRGAIEYATVAYGAIAVSLNYEKIWSHLPSGERGVFELFICLLLLLFDSSERPPWVRYGLNGLVVLLFIYTFVIAPEASASRAALLLIR